MLAADVVLWRADFLMADPRRHRHAKPGHRRTNIRLDCRTSVLGARGLEDDARRTGIGDQRDGVVLGQVLRQRAQR